MITASWSIIKRFMKLNKVYIKKQKNNNRTQFQKQELEEYRMQLFEAKWRQQIILYQNLIKSYITSYKLHQILNYLLELQIDSLISQTQYYHYQGANTIKPNQAMLHLKQEKHLVYFDAEKQYFTSFLFTIKEKQESAKKDKNKQEQENPQEAIAFSDIAQMTASFRIQNKHVYQWQSEFYDLKTNAQENKPPKFGNIPFSLQTYFSLYKDPKRWWVNLTLKTRYSDVDQKKLIQSIRAKGVGKLIITTNFQHVKDGSPFIPPVLIIASKQISVQSKKIIKIITLKDEETVVCSGNQIQKVVCDKVSNFRDDTYSKNRSQYYIYTFQVNEKVNSEHICILKDKLYEKQFVFEKIMVKLLSPKQIFFIPSLAKTFQGLRAMIQLQNLTIIENVQTDIQDCNGIVFYSDTNSLPQRIFRSYLYDKIQDKWLIQGMVHYTRSNKQFQDCVSRLIELITQGEQVFPLVNDKYHFDQVWKIKARFFFYILANFKITRDYGSSNLVSLILEYAKKRKISSIYLFRRLKKKYGLDGSFRGIYEQQFIKSTGINRIFYQLIDIRRDNSVKYIVRQKSLANKFFKTYNLFRIRLQQSYNLTSQLMDRIVKKNKYDQIGKKKDLLGALAVPLSLKCLPYFKGKVTVQSDACQPFQLQLIEQNIIQKTKQSSNLRARPVNRKPGELQKGTDGFKWMMIDTAYVFPAFYKNQNIHQNVILQKVSKTYESEQEQIKVLNCISSRDHSQNQLICKALLQKLKMQPKAINTTISVKRKILQIIPIFINKLKDSNIWQDYYMLFRLYEPPCYDHSDDGFQFLLSLVESASGLTFNKQFNYYFDELHRILIAVLVSYQNNSQEKEQKLKILLIKALMKWKSKYSFQILKQVHSMLEIKSTNVRNNLYSLREIFPNLIIFIDEIKSNISNRKYEFITDIQNLIQKCIQKDHSGNLYGHKFIFQLQKKQKYLKSLQFMRQSFTKLQKVKTSQPRSYWICLKLFKNLLNNNKKKYGLQIQLDQLNQDQNYFLAEYLWKQLCSPTTLGDPKVHLQWIKIYRIFFFYFTPIITIYKLKKNLTQRQFLLDEAQTEQVLQNVAKFDFIPDIKWFSGYDSSGTKQQKAKYEQYNMDNNRRKRKYEELIFQEDNIITRFVMSNPGKDNWQDVAREALNIIIVIEETKQVESPDQSERFRKIVQGLKAVQNNLKRGNMPNDYTLDTLRLQAERVLRNHSEDTTKFEQIFKMVNSTVSSINSQKKQKQIQRQNEMKIFIPKDYMNENEAQQGAHLHSIRQLEEYEQMQEDNKNQNQDRQANEETQNLQVKKYESIFDQ